MASSSPEIPNDFLFLAHGAQPTDDGPRSFTVPSGIEINIYEIAGNAMGFIPTTPIMNYIALQHELECRNRGLKGAINILLPNPKEKVGGDSSPTYDVIKSDRYRLRFPEISQVKTGDTTPYIKTCCAYSTGDTIPNFHYNLQEEKAIMGIFKLSRATGDGRMLHRVGLKFINKGDGTKEFAPSLDPNFLVPDILGGRMDTSRATGELFVDYGGRTENLSDLIDKLSTWGNSEAPRLSPPITLHIIACRSLSSLAQTQIASFEGGCQKTLPALVCAEAIRKHREIIEIYKTHITETHRRLSEHSSPIIDLFDHFPYPHLFYPRIECSLALKSDGRDSGEFSLRVVKMGENIQKLVDHYSVKYGDGGLEGVLSPYNLVGIDPEAPPLLTIWSGDREEAIRARDKAIAYIQKSESVVARFDGAGDEMIHLPGNMGEVIKLVAKIRLAKSVKKRNELLWGSIAAIEASKTDDRVSIELTVDSGVSSIVAMETEASEYVAGGAGAYQAVESGGSSGIAVMEEDEEGDEYGAGGAHQRGGGISRQNLSIKDLYSSIIDPINNKKYNIYSREGIDIIKKYLNYKE